MMKSEHKICSECHVSRKCLIWCNECGKHYCSKCYKEYELMREVPEQHPHSFGEVIKS